MNSSFQFFSPILHPYLYHHPYLCHHGHQLPLIFLSRISIKWLYNNYILFVTVMFGWFSISISWWCTYLLIIKADVCRYKELLKGKNHWKCGPLTTGYSSETTWCMHGITSQFAMHMHMHIHQVYVRECICMNFSFCFHWKWEPHLILDGYWMRGEPYEIIW